MLNEENVLYGIHRTGSMSLDYVSDIVEHGIEMTGHGWYVSQSALQLSQNVAYYPDNMEIKDQLLHAHGYKGSQGSVLVRIPYEDLAKKDIFIKIEGEAFARLNPKFIVGYVPLIQQPDGTVTIDRIITARDLEQARKTTVQEPQETVSEEIINTEEEGINMEMDNSEGVRIR